MSTKTYSEQMLDELRKLGWSEERIADLMREARRPLAEELDRWRDRYESLEEDFNHLLALPCHVCGAKP